MNNLAPSSRRIVRTAVSGAFGLAAIGVLAGCSGQAAADGTASAAAASSAPAATGSASTGTTTDANTTVKDGSYTETGGYSTPGGPESVTVTVTLKSGTITALSMTASESTPNSKHYVGQFKTGIFSAVVGKKIEGLKVGAVAGSSLTPNGFNAAIAKITADAAKA